MSTGLTITLIGLGWLAVAAVIVWAFGKFVDAGGIHDDEQSMVLLAALDDVEKGI